MSDKIQKNYYCWKCFTYGHKTIACSTNGLEVPPNGAKINVTLKPITRSQ